MRKEQHKALQEKQKLNLGKPKDDFLSDLAGPLEQTKEEKRPLERHNELDGSGTLPPVSINGSGNSFSSQTLAHRPLVPPGFTSTILEKNSGPKSSVHSHEKEVNICLFLLYCLYWFSFTITIFFFLKTICCKAILSCPPFYMRNWTYPPVL